MRVDIITKGMVILMWSKKPSVALLAGLLLAGSSVPLWSATALGSPLPGPLYKLSSAPTVYVDRNGSLHAIASPKMLTDLGYTWSDLTTVKSLPASVGTPVNLVQPNGSTKVYFYQNDTLHWVPSQAMFQQNGFQWQNVYHVCSLPAPVGSPLTAATSPPASFSILSAFPNIAATNTKTLAIDALTTNGAVDTAYSGTLTVSNPTGNLTFKQPTGAYAAGPLTVSFAHGIGIVTIKAASTPGHAELRFGSNQMYLTIWPNTTSQIGWRVFTATKQSVSSINPLTATPAQLLVEPVDAAGHIVPGTMADQVGLFPNSSYPINVPFSAQSQFVASFYAQNQSIRYIFNGQIAGMSANVSAAYPMTIITSPLGAATVKVTNVQGSGTTSASVSAPVTNKEQAQLVTGIQANQTYSIQIQFETAQGQPILGLPALFGKTAYPTVSSSNQSINFSVSHSGRTTPSTLTYGHLGTNYVYLTYHTGSAHNTPDLVSLWGVPADYGNEPGSFTPPPIVELITNNF